MSLLRCPRSCGPASRPRPHRERRRHVGLDAGAPPRCGRPAATAGGPRQSQGRDRSLHEHECRGAEASEGRAAPGARGGRLQQPPPAPCRGGHTWDLAPWSALSDDRAALRRSSGARERRPPLQTKGRSALGCGHHRISSRTPSRSMTPPVTPQKCTSARSRTVGSASFIPSGRCFTWTRTRARSRGKISGSSSRGSSTPATSSRSAVPARTAGATAGCARHPLPPPACRAPGCLHAPRPRLGLVGCKAESRAAAGAGSGLRKGLLQGRVERRLPPRFRRLRSARARQPHGAAAAMHQLDCRLRGHVCRPQHAGQARGHLRRPVRDLRRVRGQLVVGPANDVWTSRPPAEADRRCAAARSRAARSRASAQCTRQFSRLGAPADSEF